MGSPPILHTNHYLIGTWLIFFYSYEMHLSQYFCGDILYSLVPNSNELNSVN